MRCPSRTTGIKGAEFFKLALKGKGDYPEESDLGLLIIRESRNILALYYWVTGCLVHCVKETRLAMADGGNDSSFSTT
jgi:hypothetical protein